MYRFATADFSQKFQGVKASNVRGSLMNNGYFLFFLDDGPIRKMVMTSNMGSHLSSGYVSSPSPANWMDTNTWNHKLGQYSISNFRGYVTGLFL